jgi:predicted TIM-barrel fold metal-dependent hydrolase
MPEIPLFDSLTHPTLDGTWIGGRPRENTLAALETAMAAHNIEWACAVGMKDIGAYALEAYADYVRSASRKIFPVAYYDFNESDSAHQIGRQLDLVSRQGYAAIKIHPGFSRIDLRSPSLRAVLAEAGARSLPVLLCTFLYRQPPVSQCTYLDFGALLSDLPQTSKIILLHGGDVNLLGLMEIIRPWQNILLDLSFTMCRYEGSSVDADIRYLFQNFDQRICVGSDNPQFSLARLRRRFEELSAGADREKSMNAAHRNLLAMFDLND